MTENKSIDVTPTQTKEAESTTVADELKVEIRPARITFTQLSPEVEDSAIDGVNHYQRVGFFCAINENPDEAIKKEKIKLEGISEERINQLKQEHSKDIDRFNLRLQELDIKLQEEKAALLNVENQLPELETERTELISKLEELRSNLQTKLKELGEKKTHLIQERQKELVSELDNLIVQLDEINEKRNNINKDIFEKNKDVLKGKVELLQRFAEEYEKIYQKTLRYSERLSQSGISSTVSGFLIYIGYTCSVAAGWFFSIFALQNALNNDTTPFSIFQAFFDFGNDFLNAFGNKFIGALAFIGVMLILLALQGGIAWLCQRVIDKKIKKVTDSYDFSLNYQTEGGFVINTEIKAENTFILWMKYIPWVFVGCIVFIMLSLGGMSDKLKQLDISLTGLFIGGVIALLSSGVVFIYLTKVIEPRFDDQAQTRWSHLWTNFELIIVILLFLGAIVFILFGIKQPLKLDGTAQDGLKGIFSLIEFTIAVMLTAFTLGYGLRYKGIENTVKELELKLKQIQDAIRDNSRPEQLNLSVAENKDFNQKFLLLRRQIFDMMAAKNELAKSMLGVKKNEDKSMEDESLKNLAKNISETLRNPYVAPLRFLFVLKPLLLKMYRRIQKILDSSQSTAALMEEDEKYFPEFKHLVAELRARISETERKLEEVEDKITGIKERNDTFYRQLNTNKEKIEQQIVDYRREISRYLKELNNDINLECAKRDYLLLKLLEGFELGGWYGQQTSNKLKIPSLEG